MEQVPSVSLRERVSVGRQMARALAATSQGTDEVWRWLAPPSGLSRSERLRLRFGFYALKSAGRIAAEAARPRRTEAKGAQMNVLTPLATDTEARQPGPEPSQRRARTVRRIAALMIFEATTLAVASALHLSGLVHGRAAPFNGIHAGAAEAVIGVVLAGAGIAMLRAPAPARTIGLAATGFAIIGFLVGLRFTTLGGHIPDIAYHVTLLPVFIASMIVLLRAGRTSLREVDQ
jgi:hypothetical protein